MGTLEGWLPQGSWSCQARDLWTHLEHITLNQSEGSTAVLGDIIGEAVSTGSFSWKTGSWGTHLFPPHRGWCVFPERVVFPLWAELCKRAAQIPTLTAGKAFPWCVCLFFRCVLFLPFYFPVLPFSSCVFLCCVNCLVCLLCCV